MTLGHGEKIARAVEIAREDGLNELGRSTNSYIRNRLINILINAVTEPYLNWPKPILTGNDLRGRTDVEVVHLDLKEDLPVEGETVSGGRYEFTEDFDSQDTPELHTLPHAPFFTTVDPTVSVLNDSTLLGPVPFGITDDSRIILDTIIHTLENNRRVELTLRPLFEEYGIIGGVNQFLSCRGEANTELEDVCLLTGLWSYSYGHWMHEHVMKIRLLERFEEVNGYFPDVMLEADPPAYKREYLDLLGIEGYIEWSGTPTTVRNLVVPLYPYPTPDSIRWFRHRMLDAVETEDIGSEIIDTTRIFISREEANNYNQIINRGEVEQTMKGYGFKKFLLENLSVKEQVALFANAELVVGSPGSGFSNIMFSENPTIIELIGTNLAPGTDWYRVSKMMGWEHRYVLSEHDAENELVVDIHKLKRAMDRYT